VCGSLYDGLFSLEVHSIHLTVVIVLIVLIIISISSITGFKNAQT
jgi:hypothetical protein